MNKENVISRFCSLATKVGSHFNESLAHDCICPKQSNDNNSFSFDEDVIKFIEDTVCDAIEKGARDRRIFDAGAANARDQFEKEQRLEFGISDDDAFKNFHLEHHILREIGKLTGFNTIRSNKSINPQKENDDE
jgi:hypothetical protein